MDKRQIVVSNAIVFNHENKVLLSQRHEPGERTHGMWHFPGGMVDFGEHPKESAIRELKEETGTTIEITDEKPYVRSTVYDNAVQVILLFYKAKHISGEIDTNQDIGTSDAKWFKTDEIDFATCLPNIEELLTLTKGESN